MIKVFYRFCGKSYQEQHTAAYQLLYAALCFCGYRQEQFEVRYDENGKPFLVGEGAPFISISHCENIAICTLGDCTHGVDIQKNAEISERVSKKYLDGLTGEDAVIRWTELESRGKLTGKGIFQKDTQKDCLFTTFRDVSDFFITVCHQKNEVVFSDLTLL